MFDPNITFSNDDLEKDRLLIEILQNGKGVRGYTVIWREYDRQTMLLNQLVGDGLVVRDGKFGAVAELTEEGIKVATRGSYSKWKLEVEKEKTDAEKRKNLDDEIRLLQYGKLKYDYGTRRFSIIALVISIIAIAMTIYTFLHGLGLF